MNAPRFVWLDDPTALDQILLTQVEADVVIAECGKRQGCWASAETPTAALDLLAQQRDYYDETFGARPCGCLLDPSTGEHHDRDGLRCTHTNEEKR